MEQQYVTDPVRDVKSTNCTVCHLRTDTPHPCMVCSVVSFPKAYRDKIKGSPGHKKKLISENEWCNFHLHSEIKEQIFAWPVLALPLCQYPQACP